MTYKNIVFDLDDTLYDHLLPFKNSIIQCFPELDISEIELIYKRFRYWSDIAFPKYTNKQISIEELRIFRCKQIISEFGSFSISDDLALSFQKTYENILRLVVKKSPTGESTHYFFHSQDDKVEVSC
ncbi:haloacid dehalogenase [Streptococcus suis]|nr:haloacid dehalogenase [Streptococcus suis]